MINNKVMGKFKFEVLGIGEIGASQPKSNSILVVDKQDNIKTKMTAKVYMDVVLMMMHRRETKKAEKKEGGVLLMDKDKTLVRHSDMINCVKHGIHRPDVYAFTIDTIQESGSKANKMTTRKHIKQTFSLYDDKRYLIEDYHSCRSYGHKDAK